MKVFIAGLVAGLVLATTGVAVAGVSSGYWTGSGSAYKCQGIVAGANCKTNGYELWITRSFVALGFRGHNLYYCSRWRIPEDSCTDVGP